MVSLTPLTHWTSRYLDAILRGGVRGMLGQCSFRALDRSGTDQIRADRIVNIISFSTFVHPGGFFPATRKRELRFLCQLLCASPAPCSSSCGPFSFHFYYYFILSCYCIYFLCNMPDDNFKIQEIKNAEEYYDKGKLEEGRADGPFRPSPA